MRPDFRKTITVTEAYDETLMDAKAARRVVITSDGAAVPLASAAPRPDAAPAVPVAPDRLPGAPAPKLFRGPPPTSDSATPALSPGPVGAGRGALRDRTGGPGSTPDGSSPYPMSVLPQVGDVVGGHYRLVRLLGKGMFGRVYVAERVDVPAHHVALKVVPREVYSGRNVERELVMLAAASHPNIVQLKDHGTGDRYVWLTMPVYEGETLADRLKRGVLTPREAYDIFLPVARALDALHKAGLRHQDIKPENIFLAVFAGRTHPILLDLGVAAERDARFVAGTILFASPEQLAAFTESLGERVLSDKIDTYCLAASLLVALVGPTSFPGEGAESHEQMSQAQRVRAERPLGYDVLPDVQGRPRELLQDAFRRWLAIDPSSRPTVARMADELEVLLAPERERERKRARGLQRAQLVRRATVAAVLVLSGVAGIVVYSKRELLRLARDLDRARIEGSASFDKLETCIASNQIAERQSQECRDERARDQRAYQAALAQLAQTGPAGVAERARQLATIEAAYAAKARSYEDQISLLYATYQAAEARAVECRQHEGELTGERDDARAALGGRSTDLDKCKVDLTAALAHPHEMLARSESAAPTVPHALSRAAESAAAPPFAAASASTAPPAASSLGLPAGPAHAPAAPSYPYPPSSAEPSVGPPSVDPSSRSPLPTHDDVALPGLTPTPSARVPISAPSGTSAPTTLKKVQTRPPTTTATP